MLYCFIDRRITAEPQYLRRGKARVRAVACRYIADDLARGVAVGGFLDRDILAGEISREAEAVADVFQHLLHFAGKCRHGRLAGVHPTHFLAEPVHHVVCRDCGHALSGDRTVNVERAELRPGQHRRRAAVIHLYFLALAPEQRGSAGLQRKLVGQARPKLQLVGNTPQDINADDVPEP